MMETSMQEEPQEGPQDTTGSAAAVEATGPDKEGLAASVDTEQAVQYADTAVGDKNGVGVPSSVSNGAEQAVAPVDTSADAVREGSPAFEDAGAPPATMEDAGPTENVGEKRIRDAVDAGLEEGAAAKRAAANRRKSGSRVDGSTTSSLSRPRATSPAVGKSAGGQGKKERRSTPCVSIQVPLVTMIRAPILAKNWVVKSGKGVRVQKGHFPAMLVDAHRLGEEYLSKITDECGYDPVQHDVVMFFEKDRRTGRCQGEFGAVVKGTWGLWTKEASDRCRQNDRVLVASVQRFYKDEMFGWMQCEECQAWRQYPRHEIVFARDGYFACSMASMWNPLITSCDAAQEYDDDGDEEPQLKVTSSKPRAESVAEGEATA